VKYYVKSYTDDAKYTRRGFFPPKISLHQQCDVNYSKTKHWTLHCSEAKH